MRLGKYQKQWLTALRSGRYYKGTRADHEDEGAGTYSAIGVACEIFKEHLGLIDVVDSPAGKYDHKTHYETFAEVAPERLWKFLKLKSYTGCSISGTICDIAYSSHSLFKTDKTFTRMASYIEKNKDDLFRGSI